MSEKMSCCLGESLRVTSVPDQTASCKVMDGQNLGHEFHLFHLVGADWGTLRHARQSFQSFKCGRSCWEAQPWIQVLVGLVHERKQPFER